MFSKTVFLIQLMQIKRAWFSLVFAFENAMGILQSLWISHVRSRNRRKILIEIELNIGNRTEMYTLTISGCCQKLRACHLSHKNLAAKIVQLSKINALYCRINMYQCKSSQQSFIDPTHDHFSSATFCCLRILHSFIWRWYGWKKIRVEYCKSGADVVNKCYNN